MIKREGCISLLVVCAVGWWAVVVAIWLALWAPGTP